MMMMIKPAPGLYKGTAGSRSHHNNVSWARNTKYIMETQEGCLPSLSEGTKKKEKETNSAMEIKLNNNSTLRFLVGYDNGTRRKYNM
jgi:hypothetical protein